MVDAGIEIVERFAGESVEPDEAVIAAVAGKGKCGAVGRPAQARRLSARVNELRGLASGQIRDPYLALLYVDDPIALRRNGWGVPLAELTCLAILDRNTPDALIDTLGETARIRILAAGKLEVAPADIDEGFAVGRPGD